MSSLALCIGYDTFQRQMEAQSGARDIVSRMGQDRSMRDNICSKLERPVTCLDKTERSDWLGTNKRYDHENRTGVESLSH